MNKQEQIFKNLKSLRKIASIEALVSDATNINQDLYKKQNNDLLSQTKTLDGFEMNIEISNQINKLKLHLKDAEIALLKEKIEDKSVIISKFDKTEPAKVNTLLSDIRLAISNAKEDISKNDPKSIKTFTAPQNIEGVNSEFVLSSETKEFIELLLNQVVSQNLDNVIQDIIGHKIEKKNKVLDLSEVAVSPKNDT
ncbi:hypothetical protein OA085_00290 [Alphaproteobacteria bacterium]|nr:hypothetical protein [Alphaproteobacteria bacterium]